MKKLFSSMVLAGAMFAPAAVWADTEVGDAKEAPRIALPTPAYLADAAPPKKISGVAGATFSTAYVSRGIVLENQGLITQPYGELDFTILENADSPLNKVVVYGGIWSSLHTNHEFAGSVGSSTLDAWYEFDWYVGARFDVFKNVNLDLQYVEFISPSNAFGTAKNVQLKTSYNDSDVLGAYALHPYATVFVETDGKAGTGKNNGVYVELGVGPGFTINEKSDYPVTFTFPLAVGLGFSDFYGGADGKNQTFGFASAGVVLSVPLKFMSDAGYGSWTASVGGTLYYFDNGVRAANTASTGSTLANPDQYLVVGSASVGVAF